LFRGPPIEKLQLDLSESLEFIDRRSEGEVETSLVGIDRLHPFGLREGDSSEDGSVLSEASTDVPLSIPKAFGWFMQFYVTRNQNRTRIRSTEWCELFDPFYRIQVQLLKGGFGIDVKLGLGVGVANPVTYKLAKGFTELGDAPLFDT
jgi:hypothetical protein